MSIKIRLEVSDRTSLLDASSSSSGCVTIIYDTIPACSAYSLALAVGIAAEK